LETFAKNAQFPGIAIQREGVGRDAHGFPVPTRAIGSRGLVFDSVLVAALLRCNNSAVLSPVG
jgi:hypothetical protein